MTFTLVRKNGKTEVVNTLRKVAEIFVEQQNQEMMREMIGATMFIPMDAHEEAVNKMERRIKRRLKKEGDSIAITWV